MGESRGGAHLYGASKELEMLKPYFELTENSLKVKYSPCYINSTKIISCVSFNIDSL